MQQFLFYKIEYCYIFGLILGQVKIAQRQNHMSRLNCSKTILLKDTFAQGNQIAPRVNFVQRVIFA